MTEILLSDLTTKALNGIGTFDELMSTIQLRLDEQYGLNRIQSTDYAKLYLGAMDAALQQSIAFLLNKQTSDKQADLINAQITNEVLQGTLLQAQIDKIGADQALVTQHTANAVIEGANLTKQGLQLDAQTSLIVKQEARIDKDLELNGLLDKQVLQVVSNTAQTDAQKLKTNEETLLVTQNTANELLKAAIITKQGNKIDSEVSLLNQKVFTEQAQILDIVNGNSVVGVVGKQKLLYAAQTDGFTRTAEQKSAKMAVDAWAVRSSVDPDTMTAPVGIADADVTAFMNLLKAGVGI